MRKMKDSGIDWIREIPKHWRISKVKHLFYIGRGRVIAKIELENEGYPVYSSQTKNNGVLGYISTYDYDRSQLTWTTDGANAGTVFLREGKYNCTNVCGTLMPKTEDNNLHFLKYALEFIAIYHKRADTNGFKIMNNEMAEVKITLPQKIEQDKIANFLDEKVIEIDKIIELTKTTIEDYKKYKQSIITKIVTKGLDKNNKMKVSGIEWIKKMPEKWQVYKTKEFFEFGKGLPITKEDLIEDGEKVISYGQIHSKSNTGINVSEELYRYVSEKYINSNKQSIVKYNDFIFADTSEDLNGCGNCVYIDKNISIFAGYHTIILKPKTKDEMKYLAYLFLTDNWRDQIRSRVSGIKLFSITQKILKETTIIMPDPKERRDIVKYLDAKCSEIDKLIYNKEKIIEELENYKKSLIYEYVTGKKEVKTNYNNTEMAELSLRIIEQLPNNYSMCKIKLNKIQSVILKMIKYKQEPDYEKYAAGPYSEEMMKNVYDIFKEKEWVKISKDNMRDIYILDNNYKEGIEKYQKDFKEYDNEITRIIKLFKNKDTQESEIIATLFYCWNDFLIDGIKPTDNQIIEEFYAWSKRKKYIKTSKVKKCLEYMRNNNLMPNGYGKKTIQRSNNYGRK